MTHTVVAVGGHVTFKEIARTLQEWHVSAVPVLEGDGRVIGVVTEADLLEKESHRDAPPRMNEPGGRMVETLKSGSLTAVQLMTSPAASVHADARIPEAARIMARRKVKRLPVTDGEGRLAGIVSRSDLLKVFLRPDHEIAEEIRRDSLTLLSGPPHDLRVQVRDGVATLSGTLPDTSLVPVAVRLARSVEGVVDVRLDLS